MKTKQRIKTDGFGTLSKVYRDRYNNLLVTNAEGKSLKMTTKYPEIDSIEQKALRLIGHKVSVFTSQTTANWSALEYFCDIEESLVTRPNVEFEPSGSSFWDEISGEDGYIGDGVYAPR